MRLLRSGALQSECKCDAMTSTAALPFVAKSSSMRRLGWSCCLSWPQCYNSYDFLRASQPSAASGCHEFYGLYPYLVSAHFFPRARIFLCCGIGCCKLYRHRRQPRSSGSTKNPNRKILHQLQVFRFHESLRIRVCGVLVGAVFVATLREHRTCHQPSMH